MRLKIAEEKTRGFVYVTVLDYDVEESVLNLYQHLYDMAGIVPLLNTPPGEMGFVCKIEDRNQFKQFEYYGEAVPKTGKG